MRQLSLKITQQHHHNNNNDNNNKHHDGDDTQAMSASSTMMIKKEDDDRHDNHNEINRNLWADKHEHPYLPPSSSSSSSSASASDRIAKSRMLLASLNFASALNSDPSSSDVSVDRALCQAEFSEMDNNPEEVPCSVLAVLAVVEEDDDEE